MVQTSINDRNGARYYMTVVTKITQGGRIVIPAEYRQALGLHIGDEVIMQLEGEELRVLTPRQAVRRAQAVIRRYVPQDRSLADELVAERAATAGDHH